MVGGVSRYLRRLPDSIRRHYTAGFEAVLRPDWRVPGRRAAGLLSAGSRGRDLATTDDMTSAYVVLRFAPLDPPSLPANRSGFQPSMELHSHVSRLSDRRAHFFTHTGPQQRPRLVRDAALFQPLLPSRLQHHHIPLAM